jgi:hypothetical protein
MDINDCPHCGKPALSFWRKSVLGPARSTPCQSCGKRISVSWNALLASSPIILAVVTPALIPMSGTATVLLLAIAFAIAMALHWYTVRLVAK